MSVIITASVRPRGPVNVWKQEKLILGIWFYDHLNNPAHLSWARKLFYNFKIILQAFNSLCPLLITLVNVYMCMPGIRFESHKSLVFAKQA